MGRGVYFAQCVDINCSIWTKLYLNLIDTFSEFRCCVKNITHVAPIKSGKRLAPPEQKHDLIMSSTINLHDFLKQYSDSMFALGISDAYKCVR